MNVEITKETTQLKIRVTLRAANITEKPQRFDTSDLTTWIKNERKDIDITDYKLIKAPGRTLHNSLGENYLSGEWVYELIKKQTPKKVEVPLNESPPKTEKTAKEVTAKTPNASAKPKKPRKTKSKRV